MLQLAVMGKVSSVQRLLSYSIPVPKWTAPQHQLLRVTVFISQVRLLSALSQGAEDYNCKNPVRLTVCIMANIHTDITKTLNQTISFQEE